MTLHSEELRQLLNEKVGNCGVEEGLDAPCDVAYVIFLEPPTTKDPRLSLGEMIIDGAVRSFQPEPALTHCELLLPPVPLAEGDRTQFATYLGKKSSWQTDRQDGFGFYLLDHGSRWRAVPVFSSNAASRLREEADMELGVEYSLSRYLTSTRAFRWFSGWVSERRRSPAHCANLTARVLKNGLRGSFETTHNSNFYGPSSLYIELCTRAKKSAVAMGADKEPKISDCVSSNIDVLLRAPMTAATVQKAGDAACLTAVRALTMRALGALANDDDNFQRLTQQQLATALLRWVLLREQDGSPVFV